MNQSDKGEQSTSIDTDIRLRNEKMRATMKNLYSSAIIIFLAFAFTPTAMGCLITPPWFEGEWNCRIDGRPSKMEWHVESRTITSCTGTGDQEICQTQNACGVVGKFSDNGGPYYPLSARKYDAQFLDIRYGGLEPDNWRLERKNSGFAEGSTTWHGNQYPLSCRKIPNIQACLAQCRAAQKQCMKEAHTGPERAACAGEYVACRDECSPP